jgi:predicted transposase YbfD/YdcC
VPVGKGSDEQKQTNEIKIAAPLLSCLDIENKNITADALHTQKKFADHIVQERNAHYFLIAKNNQPTLLSVRKQRRFPEKLSMELQAENLRKYLPKRYKKLFGVIGQLKIVVITYWIGIMMKIAAEYEQDMVRKI